VDVFHQRVEAKPSPTAAACPWCRAELPPRDNLNFCPFCGTDLKVVPCKECGEELEPDWRFCIACGVEVAR
jgi:predicted amidophosphoribosyltransferase